METRKWKKDEKIKKRKECGKYKKKIETKQGKSEEIERGKVKGDVAKCIVARRPIFNVAKCQEARATLELYLTRFIAGSRVHWSCPSWMALHKGFKWFNWKCILISRIQPSVWPHGQVNRLCSPPAHTTPLSETLAEMHGQYSCFEIERSWFRTSA